MSKDTAIQVKKMQVKQQLYIMVNTHLLELYKYMFLYEQKECYQILLLKEYSNNIA